MKMASTAEPQLEVWGSPIAHSLSPSLHRAAYENLNLPWSYRRREVSKETLSEVWSDRSSLLTGLSLTMPLKEEVLGRVEKRLELVELLGAANTVFRLGEDFVLANTDVFGAQKTLEFLEVQASEAWIFGAGATARSVALAMARVGVEKVNLFVRNPARAEQTEQLLSSLGLDVSLRLFSEMSRGEAPDLVVSTLPSAANISWEVPKSVRMSAVFLDVTYSPWPSALALHWAEHGQTAISGLRMLIFQAIAQIRLFVHQDFERPLDNEGELMSIMLNAVKP